MKPNEDDPLIFAGSASRSLGAEIAEYLRLPLGRGEVLRFSEGNLFVRVRENVRGRHVYLIQGTVFPANDQFMELLFWIDALKRASAASVTEGRQERRAPRLDPGASVRGRNRGGRSGSRGDP